MNIKKRFKKRTYIGKPQGAVLLRGARGRRLWYGKSQYGADISYTRYGDFVRYCKSLGV